MVKLFTSHIYDIVGLIFSVLMLITLRIWGVSLRCIILRVHDSVLRHHPLCTILKLISVTIWRPHATCIMVLKFAVLTDPDIVFYGVAPPPPTPWLSLLNLRLTWVIDHLTSGFGTFSNAAVDAETNEWSGNDGCQASKENKLCLV